MKKKRLLTIFLLLISILIISGSTYAFYSVTKYQGNTTAVITSRQLALEFSDGPEINVSNILPGETIIKTFSLENKTDQTAYYGLQISDVINQFSRQEDVVYTLTSTNNGGVINTTQFPNTDKVLVEYIAAPSHVKQDYTLSIQYINRPFRQNVDKNKIVSGVITAIPSVQSYNLAGVAFDGSGNLITSGTIEIHSNVISAPINSDGTFVLENVPVGEHEIVVKNSSNIVVSTDSFVLEGSSNVQISNKTIIGGANKTIAIEVLLNNQNTVREIKTLGKLNTINIVVNNGISEHNALAVYDGHDGVTSVTPENHFEYNSSNGSSVNCTNGQTASFSANQLIISNLSDSTTCTISFNRILHTINYVISNGTFTNNSESIGENLNTSNNFTLNDGYQIDASSTLICTNDVEAIFDGNQVVINNMMTDTTCTVTPSIKQYNVSFVVNHGSSTDSNKMVNHGSNTTTTITPSTGYVNSNISCTNNQTATIVDNVVSVNNVTNNTACTITYSKLCVNPSFNLNTPNIYTDKVDLSVEYLDQYLDVTKYEFSLDNGTTWIDNGTINTYSFDNLTSGLTYNFKAKVTNECNLDTIVSKEVTLPIVNSPTYTLVSKTPNNTTYYTSKTVRINFDNINVESPTYYLLSTGSATISDGSVIKSCGSGNYPGVCTDVSNTQINANTWYVSGSNSIDLIYDSNTQLSSLTYDGNNYSENNNNYDIDHMDTTIPSASIGTSNIKSDRVTLTATCSDAESNITKYEFSKNNGSSWVNNGITNTYTFSSLNMGTDYNFVIRCTNGSGLTKTASKSESTPDLASPSILQTKQVPTSGTYAQSRTLTITYNATNNVNPLYYFKSSISGTVASGVIVSVCGNGVLPNNCTSSSVTSLQAGYWYRSSISNPSITFVNNVTLYAISTDGINNSLQTSYSTINTDNTAPSANISLSSFKSDRITVTATCDDNESDITKYEFSKDNGSNYEDNGTTNAYTFTGLADETSYTFKIRCTNGSGLTKTASQQGTTSNLTAPSIAQTSQTPSSGTYAQERVIKITFNATNNASPRYYFKSTVAGTVASGVTTYACGTGTNVGTCTASSVTTLVANTWYRTSTTTPSITYTSEGTLYAIISDKANYTSKSTYTIANIDTTVPTASLAAGTLKTDRVTLTATCSDDESNISKYEFSKDNGTTWVNKGTTASNTFTGLTDATAYTFAVRCTNGSGLTKTASKAATTKTISAPSIAQTAQVVAGYPVAGNRTIRVTFNNTNNANPIYYVKSNAAAPIIAGTITGSCGTGTNPGTCTTVSTPTDIGNTNWYRVTSSYIDVQYWQVGTIKAINSDGTNNASSSYTISNISADAAKPVTPTLTYINGSNTCSAQSSVKVKFNSDHSTGIYSYQIDVDGNGTADYTYLSTESMAISDGAWAGSTATFTPWSGFQTCTFRVRAVSNTGTTGSWSTNYSVMKS